MTTERIPSRDTSPSMGAWEWDVETGRLIWSPSIELMFGFAPGEFSADYEGFLLSVHPDDRERVSGAVQSAINGEKPYNIEHRVVWPNGSVRWVAESADIFRDEQGKPTRMIGVVHDITERKNAEDALRANEVRFRSLIEATRDWMWEIDRSGVYTYVSPSVEHLLGYKPEELVGKTPFDLMSPSEARRVAQEFGAIAKNQRPFSGLSNISLKKDGTGVFLETSGLPIFDTDGEFGGYRGIDRDITGQKRAEKCGRLVKQLVEDLLLPGRLDEKLKKVTDGVVEIFGACLARIWLFRPGDYQTQSCVCADADEATSCQMGERYLYLRAGSGEDLQADDPECAAPSYAAEIELLATSKETAIVINDVASDPRTCDSEWAAEPLSSFVGYRLLGEKGEPTGVWAAFFKKRLMPEEIAVIEGLASATAHLIQGTRATEALHESEERFRAFSEQTSIGIFMVQHDRIVYANEAFSKIVDYSVDEILSWGAAESIEKLVPSDEDREFAADQARRKQAGITEGAVQSYELQLRMRGGELKWVDMYTKSVRFFGAGADLVMLVDISERKAAENALRESEENLRITLNSIGDAVIATDAEGIVKRMNPVAERLTGWREVDAVGCRFEDVFRLIHEDTRERLESPVDKTIEKGDVVTIEERAILVAKNGEERLVADSGAPIRNSKGQLVGTVLVFRDVTDEIAIQERLRQTQKMEAIGQLAGGVAHDFNNLLTGIMGNAELLSMKLVDDDDLGLADQIIKASTRAANLTRQLLAFSRKGRMQSTSVDMHRIIQEVVELLKHSIDRRVEIRTLLEARRPIIIGDPGQLQNAILNLAVNARDAMRDGGTLSFLTRDVELDDDYCRSHTYEVDPGAYLEIDVSDTGCGMKPGIKNRIFEPFFTTKRPGEGTGLGLAGVYGCVKGHRGLVTVYSEPDKGSTFKVFIPRGVEPPKSGSEEKVSSLVHGEGAILVVDDEEIVRNFAAKTLTTLGYDVATCVDGREAVDYFRKHHEEIDLVVLDLIMPRMGGEETFRQMRRIDSNVKIMIASGFSRNRVAVELLKEGAVGFLDKPFRVEQLSHDVACQIQRKS